MTKEEYNQRLEDINLRYKDMTDKFDELSAVPLKDIPVTEPVVGIAGGDIKRHIEEARLIAQWLHEEVDEKVEYDGLLDEDMTIDKIKHDLYALVGVLKNPTLSMICFGDYSETADYTDLEKRIRRIENALSTSISFKPKDGTYVDKESEEPVSADSAQEALTQIDQKMNQSIS